MKKTVVVALILSLVVVDQMWASNITVLRGGIVKERGRGAHEGIIEKKIKIRKIEQELKVKKGKVKGIKETKRHVIWELDSLERRIYEENRRLEALEQDLKETQRRIVALDQRIGVTGTKCQKTKSHLGQRVRWYYKLSQLAFWNLIFSAQTFADLTRYMRYFEYLIAHDTNLLRDHRANLASLHTSQVDLSREERKLSNLRSEIENKKLKIERKREKKLALLRDIKSKENLYLAAIQDLEDASKELQKTISAIEKKRRQEARWKRLPPRKPTKTKGFVSLKGKLPPPVKGKIVTFYGKEKHPRFNTFIFHNGIRIKAPYGSKFRSVYPGKVIYSDWFKGYGKIIIIDHGDGYYSLSCHASKLFKKVGDAVRQGELLGLVGNSGSLYGSGLYFEIRHGSKSVDPLNWLATSELAQLRR